MSIDQRNDFQDYSLTAALTMSFMAALRFAVAGAESKTNEAIRKKVAVQPTITPEIPTLDTIVIFPTTNDRRLVYLEG